MQRAFLPSFPLHLTVYSDIPEGKSALFDLGLGPGFRTRDWKSRHSFDQLWISPGSILERGLWRKAEDIMKDPFWWEQRRSSNCEGHQNWLHLEQRAISGTRT